MPASPTLALGAPGLYRHPEPRLRELGAVRMDVCAFLGVAPRGPAREPVLDPVTRSGRPDPRVDRPLRRTVPVAVESFDDYRRWFGGFSGPGLLPYAVAAFFENGGRTAYVARIVHQYDTAAANDGRTAHATIGGARSSAGPLRIRARSEGAWGNRLHADLAFRYHPLNVAAFGLASVSLPEGERVEAGTLLRLTLANGARLHRALTVLTPERPGPGRAGSTVATLDSPLPALPVEAETVVADLTISDDDDPARTERHAGLGLSPLHSRWLGAALAYDSHLVHPLPDWIEAQVEPDPAAAAEPFSGGEDAYEAITPDDFFDARWNPGDEEPGDGVACLTGLPDVSLLVVPDLYSPAPLAPPVAVPDPAPGGSPVFVPCVPRAPADAPPPAPPADLEGLRLDPVTDLAAIRRLQEALVEFAAGQQEFIVLLDVPPGLSPRQVLSWRSHFNSAYAAAYHPWLRIARADDARDGRINLPPSAVAAGIIAQRERLAGLPHGPANVLAAGAVDVLEAVPESVHDELHPQGLNVFLRDRDGVRLTAARTLSRDASWRQLNVRRLVTMLRRTLRQQMQWAVFEPNTPRLRQEIRRMVTGLLRRLYQAGAFRGATEAEAFFVQCDEALNPAPVVEAGQVITHIGVAPSEPVEFIVLRLLRDGDGTLTLED